MKTEPLIIKKTYNTSIQKLWKAITDRDEMKEWYFDLQEFKPEVGFEFKFVAGSDEKKYLHLCKVTEVIIGKKLAYSWRYDGYPGNSFITFELFEEGNKARLQLTHEGLETFPQDNKDFARGNFSEGWNYFVGNLEVYLEKIKQSQAS